MGQILSPVNSRIHSPASFANRSRLARVALSTLLLAGSCAFAQPHEQASGPYVLRSTVTRSTLLSAATADKHGIERGDRVAVLNVAVLRQGSGVPGSVPAQVHAQVRNLAGVKRDVDLEQVAEAGGFSYLGTFRFSHGEVLDFRITATPLADKGTTLTLAYRDRMWRRDRQR